MTGANLHLNVPLPYINLLSHLLTHQTEHILWCNLYQLGQRPNNFSLNKNFILFFVSLVKILFSEIDPSETPYILIEFYQITFQKITLFIIVCLTQPTVSSKTFLVLLLWIMYELGNMRQELTVSESK